MSHVICDEVHERSLDSDCLLIILKELLASRKNLKIVLMSATLNAKILSAYFGGCPVVEVPGFCHPVKELFLEDIIEETHFTIEDGSPYAKKQKRPERYEAELMDELENSIFHDEEFENLQQQFAGYSPSTVRSLGIIDFNRVIS